MTKKTATQPVPEATGHKRTKTATHHDVLTTAEGKVGPYGYSRGIILTAVPADLVNVHAAWMNADAAVVKAARAAGAAVVPFKG